jgi:hypothetical protein
VQLRGRQGIKNLKICAPKVQKIAQNTGPVPFWGRNSLTCSVTTLPLCHPKQRRREMKIKTAVAALALVLAPTLSLAEGCNYGKEHQAMSCADGTAYDATSKSCVAVNA